MKRSLVVISGLALSVGVLTACSGSSISSASSAVASSSMAAPSSSAASPSASPTVDAMAELQAANAKTQAAGSASVATEMLIGFGQQNRSVSSSGVRNFATNESKVDVTFNDGAKATEVITKTYAYLQTAESKPGWYQVGISEDTPSVVDGQSLLKIIPDLSNVKLDGTETLNGVETTRYIATLSPELALSFSGLSGDERTQLAGKLTDAKPSGLAYWVDNEGRIVRASHVAAFTANEIGSVGTAITVSFSNFGVTTDIKVPTEDQLVQRPESQ